MRRIGYLIIAFLFAALLPQDAAQAAEQETVILTAEQGKAAVEIEIPDDAGGVSTLRLRVRIEGDLEHLDSTEPVKFMSDENIKPVLLETRYNAEKGWFTLYLSDTEKVTDKSRFSLGYLVPNLTDSKATRVTVSVPEDGLEYVDGTGQLKDPVSLRPSMAVLDVNLPDGNPEGPGKPENGAAGNGGTADGSVNTAEDAAGSGSEGTAEKDNMQGGNNAGEVVTDVQTGDSTSIIPFCAIAVLSALAVFSVLAVQRKKVNRK